MVRRDACVGATVFSGETEGRNEQTEGIKELFAGRHFDCEMIILCVGWYLHDKLSFRDLVEILTGRSLHLAHTTILRCARRCIPEFVQSQDHDRFLTLDPTDQTPGPNT